jgi:inosose dehydratase
MDASKVKLAIAPIGWTNDDMPELGGEIPFEQCIAEMAEAGFQGSEVGGKYPKDPDELKAALEPLGLEIASQWFSAFFTTKDLEETVEPFMAHMEFLKAMGAKVIVISEQGNSIQGQMDTPVLEAKPVLDDEGWERLVKGLETIGQLAVDNGMKIVYHHHMGTVVQTAEEVDKLMALTNPDLVWLLLDTGHMYYSDGDPLAVLQKYSSRIAHVHLKDVRDEVKQRVKDEQLSFLQSVKAGVFTVPGDGAIDFKPILDELDAIGYEGWMVVEAEQDPAIAIPLEYAKKAREYIRDIAGI